MINKKDKRGFLGITLGIGLMIVSAVALLIGLSGTLKIVSVINSIPTWGWIAIGIFVVFLMVGNKK